MKEIPQFECYVDCKTFNGTRSPNYGLNSLRFWDSEGNCFWFSYKTLVAFKPRFGNVVCQQNLWGTTTGGHLNAIEPNKKARVDAETFERLYAEAFGAKATA